MHLVSLTSTSLKVSWVAPPAASRHGAIVGYSISYQAPAGEDAGRHEVPGISADATSHVLEELEKWTEYQVWVRAHTDVGPGPESAAVRIKTKEDGELGPSRPPLPRPPTAEVLSQDPPPLRPSLLGIFPLSRIRCRLCRLELTVRM